MFSPRLRSAIAVCQPASEPGSFTSPVLTLIGWRAAGSLRSRIKTHILIVFPSPLLSSLLAVGGKLYENSHSLTPPDAVNLGVGVGVGVGFKRAQPSTSGAGPGLVGAGALGGGGGDDSVKKKKKGNWRNRFGPCFTTDTKPPLPLSEPAPSLTLPVSVATGAISSSSSSSSSAIASPSPSSSALSGRPGLGGMAVGGGAAGGGGGGGGGGAERMMGVVGAGIQKSPSLLRNGTLPGYAGATPTGAGRTRDLTKRTHLILISWCY